MSVSYDYTGKVVLVTGGGSGIGRESVLAFAKANATIAIADISEKNGKEVAEEVRKLGAQAEFFKVDVGDENSVKELIENVVNTFGALHIAHNNAGIEGDTVPLAELSGDNWRKVIDVDLSSVFYCLKYEIPEMIKSGYGAIVNTASASGLIGGYNLSVYTAAKHGVVGLTKAAALDYGKQGIRVNALCPGPIDTPFLDSLPQKFKDRLTFASAMERLGKPEEMAQSVLWLCSEHSQYITGHSLSVDGGVVLGGVGTKFSDLV